MTLSSGSGGLLMFVTVNVYVAFCGATLFGTEPVFVDVDPGRDDHGRAERLGIVGGVVDRGVVQDAAGGDPHDGVGHAER